MGCLTNPDLKSSDLLNAIKNSATTAYKERIPTATKDNLAEVGSAILRWDNTRNEFINALLNRIGKVEITRLLFENPLKEFKKNTMSYGKTIEEVFVDLVKANAFDPVLAETQLYKRNLPDVKSVFHNVNRQDVYPTTVSEAQLQTAFLSEEGMGNLISKIIDTPRISDEYDEFLLMKNVIHQWGIEGRFHLEEITDPIDEQTAKNAVVKIKELSNSMSFPSSNYNYAGVKTATPKTEQIILVNSKFDAIIDVEVLASAFNMSKADFMGRRILIDDFGGLANVVCAVLDPAFFMVYDTLLRTESQYNPLGLYTNYMLHHWQVISASPFAQGVLFVTTLPTLTAIDLKPSTASVSKGCSVQFVVEATGTNNPPSKSTFTLTGANSAKTSINTLGLLVIGEDETATTITVTATSVFNDTISDTATVTVV